MLNEGKTTEAVIENGEIGEPGATGHLLRQGERGGGFREDIRDREPLYSEGEGRPSIDPVVCSNWCCWQQSGLGTLTAREHCGVHRRCRNTAVPAITTLRRRCRTFHSEL